MMDIKIQVSKTQREYKFELNGWSFLCKVLCDEDEKTPIETLIGDLKGIVATLDRMVEEAKKAGEPKVTLADIIPPHGNS